MWLIPLLPNPPSPQRVVVYNARPRCYSDGPISLLTCGLYPDFYDQCHWSDSSSSISDSVMDELESDMKTPIRSGDDKRSMILAFETMQNLHFHPQLPERDDTVCQWCPLAKRTRLRILEYRVQLECRWRAVRRSGRRWMFLSNECLSRLFLFVFGYFKSRVIWAIKLGRDL